MIDSRQRPRVVGGVTRYPDGGVEPAEPGDPVEDGLSAVLRCPRDPNAQGVQTDEGGRDVDGHYFRFS